MSSHTIYNKEDEKISELSKKIIKELDGYTLSQISTCFYKITQAIEKDMVLDCSGLSITEDRRSNHKTATI